MDLKVKGKTVLITGATQGIGRETALIFAREGANVAITYRSQKEKGDEVAHEIEKAGVSGLAVYMDLGDEASIRACAAEVEKKLGGIDILINNAVRYQDWGKNGAEKFESIPTKQWIPVLRDTIEGTYLMTQLAVPHMRKNKWGRIVFVSSGIAMKGYPARGTYGAAKEALHGLTKSLAMELGPEGILVNTVMSGVAPGARDLAALPQATRDMFIATTSIRRLLTAAEVAGPIAYFGSGENTVMTSQIVYAGGS